MRLMSASLVLAVLVLSSCQTGFQNVRRFDVKHDRCRAFVVIQQDWNYPIGFIDEEGNLKLVKADLDVLGQIDTIWFSSTGKRMIIESHGEGHQFISVYDVSTVVDYYGRSEMIDPVRTLDPYPYAFSNIRWLNEDTIQFSSPSDFTKFDREQRRGKYGVDWDDETDRTWQWNIKTDTFKEVPSR